jgi:iron complex transport system permease protein
MAGSVALPLAELPRALASLLAGSPTAWRRPCSTCAWARQQRLRHRRRAGAGRRHDAGAGAQSPGRSLCAGRVGGAAVGALAALLFGAALWAHRPGALAGAIAHLLLLYLLARRDLGGGGGAPGGESGVLLLTGVVLASACMALVTLMLSVAPESRLRGMVFWMIGDLAGTSWRLLPWLVLAGCLLLAMRRARSLNVMALHADAAVTLGVNVAGLRRFLFICSGLLTACAVTTGGSIGFVGLVVPHACRHAFGPITGPVARCRAGRRRLPVCWPTRWRAPCSRPSNCRWAC